MILTILFLVWWAAAGIYYAVLLHRKPVTGPVTGPLLYRMNYRLLASWEWLIILPFVVFLILFLLLKETFIKVKKSWKQ